MNAEKLFFLTDIKGLYRNIDDPESFISRLTAKEAKELLDKGFVGGGLIPKLGNCIDAIEGGVIILGGRILHCLLLEIFTKKGVGTAIVKDEDGL